MKEILQRRGSYSLEDVMRAHPQKPTKEMLKDASRARGIIQEFRLANFLGLDNTDSVLLQAFMAERLIKTRLYDLDWETYSPEFISTPKDIVKDEKERAGLQASFDRVVMGRGEIVEKSYGDKIMRLRARNLELAANDLIARGSVYNEDSFTTEVIISDELVDRWVSRWEYKFKSKYGHSRQKDLYYRNRV